jgi:hypothetical protein
MNTEEYAPFVLADEARSWVMDVVPNGDDVDEATDAEVMAFVAKHYEGGTLAFAADCYAYYGFDVLAASLRTF